MIPKKLCSYFIYIIILIRGEVYCDEKSSLTFVIDDTSSMTDEIDQVKSSVNRIFNAVMNSKQSQIENFILVTFNDHDYDSYYSNQFKRDYVKLRTITRDKLNFTETLSKIKVYGGGDCPEYSMSGIMVGIERSLPRSTIYVFTDATAKDYLIYEEVKNLAVKKQSTVTFIISNNYCVNSMLHQPDYKAYQDLAEATAGTVFNVQKQEVNKIINDIVLSIQGRRTVLFNRKVTGFNKCQVNFDIDYKYKDPVITVTGQNPSLTVIGPDGTYAKTETKTETSQVLIVLIVDSKPGNYKATVGCRYETHVKVAAQTEIIFQHGFSTSKVSFKDAATRPLPGVGSYIYIKVTDGNIILETLKIIDINSGRVLNNIPLSVLNENEKLYITTLVEFSEKTLFQLEINGYDPITKESISRKGSPIEVQPPPPVVIEQKAPEVTIMEGARVNVDYNGGILLTCKVFAYPAPDIVWTTASGSVLNKKSTEVELYEYNSYLQLSNITNSGSYYCKASNVVARNKMAKVNVDLWFQVKSAPSEITTAQYGEEKKLHCNIVSMYPMDIKWKTPLSSSKFSISSDKKVLTIHSVGIEAQGLYTCEMTLRSNPVKTHNITTKVVITNLETPLITYANQTTTALNGQRMVATCLVTGIPKPSVRWQFKSKYSDVFADISYRGEQLSIPSISYEQAGSYRCIAQNKVGTQSGTIEVDVHGAPEITISDKTITVMNGQRMTAFCKVTSIPKPSVRWQFKSKHSVVFADISNKGEQLSIPSISYEQAGSYRCIAQNEVGTQSGTIEVNVHGVPEIRISNKSITVLISQTVTEYCKASGIPKPSVRWQFKSKHSDVFADISNRGEQLNIPIISYEQAGSYRCIAQNEVGTQSGTIEVDVHGVPEIRISNKNITFVIGQTMTEYCKASGIPKPSVRWQFKSKHSVAFADISNKGEQLIIPSISYEQAGSYRCIAHNEVGTQSGTIEVDVHGVPEIRISNKNITVVIGQTMSEYCKASGIPKPSVRWQFKSKNSDVFADISNKGEQLSIPSISYEQAGSYRCIAHNEVGTQSGTIEVYVHGAPELRISNKNITVLIGQTTTEYCKVTGIPKPSVRWQFKSKHSVAFADISNKGEQLSIPSISYEQAGSYRCIAHNEVGTQSGTIEVDVHGVPEIRISNKNITVVIGQTMSEYCKATGMPKPIVRWQFKSKNSVVFADISNRGEQLSIPSISYEQAGSYRCIAQNEVGTRSGTIEVDVHGAPEITLSDKTITVMNGQSMAAFCKANGIPKPVITWQFKSQYSDVYVDLSDKGEQLTKPHISYESAGLYKCTATNKIGTQSGIVEVIVHGKPNITNVDTVYTGVTGDWVLKIPCDVTGVPEPTITWKHEGNVVTTDGKISVIDNALVIKNPNEKDSSKFTCEALNEYGYANKSFASVISDFIDLDEQFKNYYYLKPGESADIKCRLEVDVDTQSEVRWYVNGQKTNVTGMIYSITNAVFSNDGNYTCRWNTNEGSGSLNYVVDVGYKPSFITTPLQTVDWNGDNDVLDCNVRAKPLQTVNKWTVNGKQVDGNETELAISGWGTYVCDVSNPHGSVQRVFTVTSHGCLIDRTVDKVQNTPLVINDKTSTWTRFDPSYTEFLTVEQGDVLILECSTQDQTTNTFVTHPNTNIIKAECAKEDKFIVDGGIYKFNDLQCKENVRSSQISKTPCMKNKGKIIEIGFKLKNGFLGVYDVCYSATDHRTLYTKVLMSEVNIGNTVGPSFELAPEDGTAKIGGEITKCQYNQRRMVSPVNVAFGPAQVATLSDRYNTVPVYEPCEGSSRLSWSMVEDVIQYAVPDGMPVWTGASYYDTNGIPRYLWKVVKKRNIFEAIVYVNIPNPGSTDILCSKTTLKMLKEITDKGDQYTYPCSIQDLSKVFNVPLSEFDFDTTL